jgi:hypothetical protein
MHKHRSFSLVAAAIFSLLAVQSATAADVDLGSSTPVIRTGMISGGSAPIEKALATLIPEPYRIELDTRIPRNWVVVWQPGTNWMDVLKSALAPMGIVVSPDWGNSVIRVRYQPTVQVASHSQAQPVAFTTSRENGDLHVVDVLSGAVGREWNERAPYPPKGLIRFDSAVMRLLPPSLRNATLALQGVDTSMMVRWHPGASRREAMIDVLRAAGAVAHISADEVRVMPKADTSSRAEVKAVQTAIQPEPVTPSAAPVAPISGLDLSAGQPIGMQIKKQAAAQGWTVVWNVDRDWIVPSNTRIDGAIDAAITSAVKAMAAQGAPIHATVYTANHTIVIAQNGDH